MPLASGVSSLATRIGTEFKTVKASVGTLASLTTTEKTSLVLAINELAARPTSDPGVTVTLTGAQTISGIKTFTVAPVVPASSFAIAAISGLQTALNAKTQVLDTATTTDIVNTWSAKKTNDAIQAAITALTTGAPGLLDTLDEIAAAIGDDANFAANMTTSLAGRLKVDGTAQSISSANQLIALANLGAVSATAVGNTETDFVAIFNAALA